MQTNYYFFLFGLYNGCTSAHTVKGNKKTDKSKYMRKKINQAKSKM